MFVLFSAACGILSRISLQTHGCWNERGAVIFEDMIGNCVKALPTLEFSSAPIPQLIFFYFVMCAHRPYWTSVSKSFMFSFFLGMMQCRSGAGYA